MTNNKQDMQIKIQRLQKNLYSIRKIAGWKAKDLANRLGVTKQTISNLETGKVKMTQVQYIAIRAVFEYEIASNPNNVVLAKVISILLDDETNQDEEEQNKDYIKTQEENDEKIDDAVEIIATTSSSKISDEQLLAVTDALLDPLVKEPIRQTKEIHKQVMKMTDDLFDLTGSMFGSLGWLDPMSRKRRR